MKIDFLSKFKKIYKLFLIAIYFYLVGCSDSHIGEGYVVKSARDDFIHIIKGEKVIVPPAISSYSDAGKYVFGVGVEAVTLSCHDGGGYKIKVQDGVFYFVLNKKSGSLEQFSSEKKFLDRVSSIDSFNESLIDLSSAHELRDRYHGFYKNVDFSACVLM